MKDYQIIPFSYDSTVVRVIKDDSNNPWWVAKDVCDILGYSNSRKAINDHLDDDEKGVTDCYTRGGIQEMATISESGLYALIIRSNKPEAKKFRKWVTSEVLPCIRKTGSYQPKQIEADPEAMKALLVQMKNEIVQELHPVVMPKSKPGMTADEWNAAWCDLCATHEMLSKAAEQFRKDVTNMLPERTIGTIPKGADVLEHVRLYYSDMEKMARQINILVELLMWRSPKVMGMNMNLGCPRY